MMRSFILPCSRTLPFSHANPLNSPPNQRDSITNVFDFVSCPQPLLHTIIFIIEMAAAMRLAAKFNSYYAEKPGKALRPQ